MAGCERVFWGMVHSGRLCQAGRYGFVMCVQSGAHVRQKRGRMLGLMRLYCRGYAMARRRAHHSCEGSSTWRRRSLAPTHSTCSQALETYRYETDLPAREAE